MNIFDETDEESDSDKYALLFDPQQRLEIEEAPSTRYYNDFFELAQIGSGEFGNVYKCIHRLDGCTYAVKRTRQPVKGSIDEKRALNEVYAHAVLGKNNHVVRYFAAWVEDDHMHIQNEFCDGGSLASLLNEMREKSEKFTELQLKKILRHIAYGLRYIHDQKLVHLDVKPENIFISRNLDLSDASDVLKIHESSDDGFESEHSDSDTVSEVTYKIGDLGLITSLTNPSVEEGDCRYLPLEILHDNYSELQKADIFALGLTVYEAVRVNIPCFLSATLTLLF